MFSILEEFITYTRKRQNISNLALSCLLIFSHLWALPNRWYLLILVLFIGGSWLINNNLMLAFWHCYLTILPFQRSRQFMAAEIAVEMTDRLFVKHYDYFVRFSDLLLGVFAYLLIREKRTYKKNELISPTAFKFEKVLLLLLIVFAGVSVGLSTFFGFALFNLLLFCGILFHYVLAQSVTNNYKFWQITWIGISLHVGMMLLLMFIQFYRGSQLGIELEHKDSYNPFGATAIEENSLFRAAGYFHDPNAAATWLLSLSPLALWFVWQLTRKKELVYLLSLITGTGVVVTGSRVAWLVLMVNVVYMFLRFYKYWLSEFRYLKKYYRLLGVFLLLLILTTSFVAKRVWSTTHTLQEGGGVDYRKNQIMVSVVILKAQPFGLGLGMLQFEVWSSSLQEKYTTDITQPHNVFAEIGSGLGVFGLLLFCLLIYLLFRRAIGDFLRLNNFFSLVILLALFNYFFMANFYPYLLRSPLAEFFWLFSGIIFSTKKLLSKNV